MNERIGKFKKISVASARQRRVQSPGPFASASFVPLPCPRPYRSSPVSKGTCTFAAPIRAQIHLRYRSPILASFLPPSCACARVNLETINYNPSYAMIIAVVYIVHRYH